MDDACVVHQCQFNLLHGCSALWSIATYIVYIPTWHALHLVHEIMGCRLCQNSNSRRRFYDVTDSNNGDDSGCSRKYAATIPHSNLHSVATNLPKRRISLYGDDFTEATNFSVWRRFYRSDESLCMATI